jgi:hypothetical protein
MGNILAGIAVVGSILAAALSNQIADEFKAWTPWLTRQLIELWVSKLPTGIENRDAEAVQDRYREEWTRLVEDTPGQIGKLVEAASLFKASRYLKRQIESLSLQRQVQSQSRVDDDTQSLVSAWKALNSERSRLQDHVVELEWQVFDLEMQNPAAPESNGADHLKELTKEVMANLNLARAAINEYEEEKGEALDKALRVIADRVHTNMKLLRSGRQP